MLYLSIFSKQLCLWDSPFEGSRKLILYVFRLSARCVPGRWTLWHFFGLRSPIPPSSGHFFGLRCTIPPPSRHFFGLPTPARVESRHFFSLRSPIPPSSGHFFGLHTPARVESRHFFGLRSPVPHSTARMALKSRPQASVLPKIQSESPESS
ncbi:hypothetical protein DFP98_12541 [Cohnella phaseoli]|uniref:Uncharacterized protein n=1 Tax=Cohnella phaseoli TaxID=456490 RepID=A0A3D9INZ1_9BACL|nr:hypothetical protein DFP98_12541 [Cohnella phaseoli]